MDCKSRCTIGVDDSGGNDLCRILSSVSGDADIISIVLCPLVIWYVYNVLSNRLLCTDRSITL